MRENTDQKNSEYGFFSRSVSVYQEYLHIAHFLFMNLWEDGSSFNWCTSVSEEGGCHRFENGVARAEREGGQWRINNLAKHLR